MKSFYPSVILHHMEDTLEVIEQLKKCFNLVFSGLHCLRIVIKNFRAVIDVIELATYQEGLRCS